MSFGYIPHKVNWKDFLLKVIGWPNTIRRLQAPVLFKYLNIQPSDTVGDIGCGGGEFGFEIALKSKRCIAIDINLSRKSKSAVSGSKNLFLVKGDIQHLPYANQCLDKVLLSSVLQMVPDGRQLLRECCRVLKTDGTLVLSVPIDYIWIDTLNTLKGELSSAFGAQGKGYYTPSGVTMLLNKAGFHITQLSYAPQNLGSLVLEIWLYICHRLRLPLYSQFYFLLTYPLAFGDRYFKYKYKKGNELIIQARKADSAYNYPFSHEKNPERSFGINKLMKLHF